MAASIGALGLVVSIQAALLPIGFAMPEVQSYGLVFPILTAVFITSTSIVVTYVSVRAYMRFGLLSVLLLGCGNLALGCTSLVAATSLEVKGFEFSAGVFVLGALFSAVLQLACACLTYLGGPPTLRKGHYLSFWMAVTTLFVVAIVAGAVEGALPSFWVGTGTTPLGQVALGMATVGFACSSALVFAVYYTSKSGILLWYALALAATASGLLGIIVSGGQAEAVTIRLGWAALCVGGLFMLTSVLSAERLGDSPSPAGTRPA